MANIKVKQTPNHKVELTTPSGETIVLKRFAARELADKITAASFVKVNLGPRGDGK